MTHDDCTPLAPHGVGGAPLVGRAAGRPAHGAVLPPGATDGSASGTVPSGGRRRVLRVLPPVLATAVAAVGLVFTGVTVRGADTAAPTAIWTSPQDAGSAGPRGEGSEDPAASAHRGRTDNELSRALLPAPPGYSLGPDVAGVGNDTVLTGQEAGAELKASLEGLSGRQRREAEQRVDALGIRGLAGRSYQKDSLDLVVEVAVGRMEDTGAVRDWYRRELAWYAEADVPEGPAVDGQENASCVLPPSPDTLFEEADEAFEPSLGLMRCAAHEGEYFVRVTAYGAEPFMASAVVRLLKDQLDHIASPGEYV
ncbi:hypothetical protein [Streptomyces sp. C10-9-1]|uniref:hypothetical protein n=1 Tax=Streptomyces sp. C10-9-1 TaxID=1859285 RepID=UPI003F4A7FF0